MHDLTKGGRGWIVTDVHAGLKGFGRAGDRVSGYLRALFTAANETQSGAAPVKFIADLGDRGSKKVERQSHFVQNTLEYANPLSILDNNVHYFALNGNHETDPIFRAQIIKSRAGRDVEQESHSVDFGAISLNFMQAEVLKTNTRETLGFNSDEIEDYRRIKGEQVERGNRPSIDFSHIPFGNVRQNIIEAKLSEHENNDDFDDYKNRLLSSRNLAYANHSMIDQIKADTSMPLLELFGHIHTPFLGANFMGEPKMVALPAFCSELPETKPDPSAAFCELWEVNGGVSLEFKRIVRGGGESSFVSGAERYSIVANNLVPEDMRRTLAKISFRAESMAIRNVDRVLG